MNLPSNYAGMSPVITDPQTAIRRISGSDFRQIRLLPVQLTQLPACTLAMKHLRVMAQLQEYELIVKESQAGISCFMALQYTPGRHSEIRYLLIKYFAVDRFAIDRRSAIEIEAYAAQVAESTGCLAVLVRANALNAAAMKFYRERGYILNGEVLMKKLA